MARERNDDDDDDDRPRRNRRPREDDDDEDDRPRPARQKPKADNTVKVLLISGGVLVVVALICSGTAYAIYRSLARKVADVQKQVQAEMDKQDAEEANTDKARATAAVEAFVAELDGGRTTAAYALTSAGYRRRTTEAAFAATARPLAADLPDATPVLANDFAPDSGATYTFEIWAGTKAVKITAIKEGGKWAVDLFTVAAQ